MDFDGWNLVDANPGKELHVIQPLSARARALLVRNRTSPNLKGSGFIIVVGAIEMLEGLEYHHDNIIRIADALASGAPVLGTDVDHEAVAYINRLGQFFYFAQSEFVRKATHESPILIPTIAKFMIFRNKHSAHRSIDFPQRETEGEKIAHARALSSMMGTLFSPKPNKPQMRLPDHATELKQFQRDLWKDNYKTFQTFDSSTGTHINFIVEVEHPKIVEETYRVLEQLIVHKAK